jgi:hypothetical protein
MAYVTFIHGMANKPPYAALKDSWCNALSRADPSRGSFKPQGNAGLDFGVTGVGFDMTYWADVLYAEPETVVEAIQEAVLEAVIEGRSILKGKKRLAAPKWRSQLKTAEEKAFVEELRATFESRLDGYVAIDRKTGRKRKAANESVRNELRLPEFIQKPLMEELLRDVHHYFYSVEHQAKKPGGPKFNVRTELRKRFMDALNVGAAAPGPHVVVSHSMGTIIAYDCLRNCEDCPPIDTLITLGSPLGLDAVQDKLKPQGAKRVDYPTKIKRAWINIFDPLDPVVGFDPKFANDYKRDGKNVIKDIQESNWGRWRHNIVKYLSGPKLRAELREALK